MLLRLHVSFTGWACRAALAVFLAFGISRATAQSSAVTEPWLHELAAQLTAHYLPEGELTLEWARPGPQEAREACELEILTFPQALAPQMLLKVRATTATARAEHTLILRAQVWRDGYATREPMDRGSTLIPSALEPMRFDALRDREAVPAGAELDVIFVRSLPSGRLLTWRDVGRRPLVRRGQLIEVAASDGALTVTLRAVALADAGRGEIVRVRNPDSRKEFSAQVVSEAKALVRF